MAEPRSIQNLDGLTTLANRSGVDIKPTLLRVMTDLYVQKPWHTAEEEQHYTELALRLIDAVDAPTRAVVAGKLAAYAAPPGPVIRKLRQKEAGSDRMPLPAKPPSAGSAAKELCELFFGANAEERRLILLNLPYASLKPAGGIEPVAARSAIRQIEAAALGHDRIGLTGAIERALGISRALAQRLIEDQSGEPTVVMARVLDMPPDVLQRILLCLDPAISQSVLRVYELARLYDEIEPHSALRLLAIWRSGYRATAPSKPAPQPTSRHAAAAAQPRNHQPQLWHVEERPALPARPRIRWDEHALARKAENE